MARSRFSSVAITGIVCALSKQEVRLLEPPLHAAMSGTLTDDQRRRIFDRTALKQPTALASVAQTAVFLLGPGSSSITGQNVVVDSGAF